MCSYLGNVNCRHIIFIQQFKDGHPPPSCPLVVYGGPNDNLINFIGNLFHITWLLHHSKVQFFDNGSYIYTIRRKNYYLQLPFAINFQLHVTYANARPP